MTPVNRKPDSKLVGLLLMGGIHHIFHLIPIAVGLEADTNISVYVYVRNASEKQVCEDVLASLGSTRTTVTVLKSKLFHKLRSSKKRILLSNLKIWNSLDALIVADRSSTLLRNYSDQLPPFLHIPHGAGDSAVSYDPRMRYFDYILVAGEKDKKRMIDLNLVSDETCHVTGYIKPFAINQIHPETPKLFETTRPVVLYNPHFREGLSSWKEFGRDLLEKFAQQNDMNFIVAPHILLFEKTQDEESRKAVEAFSKYENIYVDLGSERACDMTYTRAADIYLGDVSSQIYEFLSEPKPCIFLTNSKTQWKEDPNFAHWRYGPVCHSTHDVMQALSRAAIDLEDYATVQTQGCLAAKGDPSWNPIQRAAAIVTSILNENKNRSGG
ncbi:CDP-glycerol glycerophosphotransferase family protein [Octadecabacter sp.]|nr:CDP-glycerol glycerophosphotransferase family protein [Octadecabacter sp.]